MKKSPQFIQYIKIDKHIIMQDISACARIILAYIEGFYCKPDTVFNCSNNFIAQELNFSVDQVKRAIKELDNKGIILIKTIKVKFGRSNRIIYSKLDLEARAAIEYFNKTYGKRK